MGIYLRDQKINLLKLLGGVKSNGLGFGGVKGDMVCCHPGVERN